MEIFDITIIGGGPVGLFAAFYAGMRQAKTKLIDSLPTLGGQLAALYPEKYIYDIAGFPAIRAIDLIDNLKEQTEQFEHTYCLDEEVLSIVLQDELLIITTNKGQHYSRSVILAVGSGSFHPRKLTVPTAQSFEEKGIDYFVNDLDKYKNKVVAIAGGGDSAIDWALMLEPVAKEVHLIHRRPNFRGHEHSVAKLMQSQVTLWTPFVIDDLTGTEEQLTQLHLLEVKKQEQRILPVDYLLVNYGFHSSLEHIKTWQLAMDRGGVVTQSDMSTSIPGVYACGDICSYEGKINLIATGLGEAPTAVNNALHFIHPEKRTQPMHSTSSFPAMTTP